MKPHMRTIVGFLDDLGATDVVIANGGKHPRVVFRWNGQEHQRVISSTPTNPDESAWRAIDDIRRSLGLIDHEKRVGERRKRAPRRRQRAIAPAIPVLTAAAAPDWRSGLVAHPAAVATLRARLDAAWLAWWRGILDGVAA